MQHLDRVRPAPRERPRHLYAEPSYQRPGLLTPDGALIRMLGAMAEPSFPAVRSLFDDVGAPDRVTAFANEVVENDAQYYWRRSKEECVDADEAAAPEARAAHQELADRYARLSRRGMRHRGSASSGHPPAARARIARMLRQRFAVSVGDLAPLRPACASNTDADRKLLPPGA